MTLAKLTSHLSVATTEESCSLDDIQTFIVEIDTTRRRIFDRLSSICQLAEGRLRVSLYDYGTVDMGINAFRKQTLSEPYCMLLRISIHADGTNVSTRKSSR